MKKIIIAVLLVIVIVLSYRCSSSNPRWILSDSSKWVSYSNVNSKRR